MKLRIVTTALMALIMCGIMSLLVSLMNMGFQMAVIPLWIRNWLIAIAALYPVSFVLTPRVSAFLKKAGTDGLWFRFLNAAVLGVTYAFWMTFVMAAVNKGFTAGFLAAWMKTFRFLAGIAVALLYFLIPPVQKLSKKLCGSQR